MYFYNVVRKLGGWRWHRCQIKSLYLSFSRINLEHILFFKKKTQFNIFNFLEK